MKLAILGATGRTGLPLVKQALDAGHEVVALARTPSKMTLKHPHLNVLQGDSLNAADVEKVVSGADVVLSVLGPVKGTPPNMLGESAKNIVRAMQQHGVRRLITLTGAGVDAPQDQPKFINHVIKFALKTLSGAVLQDSLNGVQTVQNSGLDWTIVRGPMLTEGEHTGKYRVGWVGVGTGARIARADVADFMLKQVNDTKYIHQMPMVSD